MQLLALLSCSVFLAAENNAEVLGHIYSLQNLHSAARFGKKKEKKMTDYFSQEAVDFATIKDLFLCFVFNWKFI